MTNSTHSDRKPIFLTLKERKKCEALADSHRAMAREKRGDESMLDYGKAASNYLLTRNYALAHEMKQLAKMVGTKEKLSPNMLNDSMAASVISVGVLGGITFLYSGISGNAIADSSTKPFNWIGMLLLLIAIVFGLFYIIKKKRK